LDQLIFAPLVPLVVIAISALIIVAGVVIANRRGLVGWWLRGVAALALLLALANPSLQCENRTALSDIVIVIVDESASQRISDRSQQTQEALDQLREQTDRDPNTELRIVRVGDVEGDGGTLLMTALADAMAEEPRARISGVLFLTDGRLHDIERLVNVPAPVHALMTGRSDDWDRRLVVKNAPAFAILGEPVTLTLLIEDQGEVPEGVEFAELSISVDGEQPLEFQVPIGREIDLPVDLPHGGMNVLQFSTPEIDGELTDRNNAAVVQINGVRDRLRVLLVSGEPHPGERTWRNLLKSDSSVDLVHFTILRPPEKQDGVPVNELSLIAFPTRELFLEKIEEFDLIIFDRYKRRGILPTLYFESIRNYVENGGAVLIAAGPDFAGADSLYRSALGGMLPAAPTARVFEEGFVPQITELGARHPVTEGLESFAPETEEGTPGWGRWLRLIDLVETAGTTVMSGIDDRPLLVLDRVGEGRVALLGSDQAWLWSRGYEGGGPQLELLRRLAHWMMKEPQLEEEALWAEAIGQEMRIIRRSLGADIGAITVTRPDGQEVVIELTETSPGRFEAVYDAPEIGLYRLSEGGLDVVMALGPTAPKEFEQTIATSALLDPMIESALGNVVWLRDGIPLLRNVREGRPAFGRGWIGVTPRGAYVTADVTVTSLVPAWVFLLAAAMLIVGAWLREGRR
jgi:hypothetical protein